MHLFASLDAQTILDQKKDQSTGKTPEPGGKQ
jgi:hypothetical protein